MEEQNFKVSDFQQTQGMLLNIQRFCTQDGPGVRTTVFLKGCPLRCLWCSNPESQHLEAEYVINPIQCMNCGTCAHACPSRAISQIPSQRAFQIDPGRCTGCGTCFSICPSEAVRRYGYTATVDQVLTEVLQDQPYYRRTGGGMTISGGEPAVQWAFSRELLSRCKELDIHTLIETAGAVPYNQLWAIAEFADTIYFDLKLADAALHLFYTGTDNTYILENLRCLSVQKSHLVVRIPLIPGINDSKQELTAIAEILHGFPSLKRVGLLPYHKFGVNKYALLSRSYALLDTPSPDAASVESARALLEGITKKEVLIGI